MMKTTMFGVFLIIILFLIKHFDKQRDYFNTEPSNRGHLDHNSFNEAYELKPMGSTLCPPGNNSKTLGKRYRSAICNSKFVPKNDDMRSEESKTKN